MSVKVAPITGDGSYYTRHLLLEEQAQYLAAEMPGVWLGRGTKPFGLTGRNVELAVHKNMFQGLSPDGRERTVQNAGSRKRQIGWELNISWPKELSALWAVGPSTLRERLLAIQEEAVQLVLNHVQNHCAFTRRGKGGHRLERVDLIFARYRHWTNRLNQPLVHEHILVPNLGVRADGTTGTVLSHALYRHQRVANALYQLHLVYRLREELGLTCRRRNYSFEVAGVPASLTRAWSGRREQILDTLSSWGTHSPAAAAAAARATRPPKQLRPLDELRREWMAEARRHGFDPARFSDLRPQPASPLGRLLEGTWAAKAVRQAARDLVKEKGHFDRWQLLTQAAYRCLDRPVPVAKLEAAVSLALERTRRHGLVEVGQVHGEPAFTTREQWRLEQKLLRDVEALQRLPNRAVPSEKVEAVLAGCPQLSNEQSQAVRALAALPGRLGLLTGLAGSGKTSTLRALADAYRGAGKKVIGVAVTGRAADILEQEAGVPSRTLARLLLDLSPTPHAKVFAWLRQHDFDSLRAKLTVAERLRRPKDKLTRDTVLLLDEASLVSTPDLQRLVRHCRRARATLVLAGDPAQHQSVQAGGGFDFFLHQFPSARLTEIRRQRQPQEREAVKAVVQGEGRRALESYAREGRLHVAADRLLACEALLARYRQDGALERPCGHLIITNLNAEVRHLNGLVQDERRRAGLLGEQALTLKDGLTFHAGDRVMFTRNDAPLGVRNGQLATVTAVDARRQSLTVVPDHGRELTVPTREYAHLTLGYAVTAFKAQGMTGERVYALVGGSMTSRESAYVQLSRGRERTEIFTDRYEAGRDLADLARQVTRSVRKRMAVDVAAGRHPELDRGR